MLLYVRLLRQQRFPYKQDLGPFGLPALADLTIITLWLWYPLAVHLCSSPLQGCLNLIKLDRLDRA